MGKVVSGRDRRERGHQTHPGGRAQRSDREEPGRASTAPGRRQPGPGPAHEGRKPRETSLPARRCEGPHGQGSREAGASECSALRCRSARPPFHAPWPCAECRHGLLGTDLRAKLIFSSDRDVPPRAFSRRPAQQPPTSTAARTTHQTEASGRDWLEIANSRPIRAEASLSSVFIGHLNCQSSTPTARSLSGPLDWPGAVGSPLPTSVTTLGSAVKARPQACHRVLEPSKRTASGNSTRACSKTGSNG